MSSEIPVPSSNWMWPAVGSISLTSILPVVVLPQPDSPTSPRLSPAMRSNDTSSTAWTKLFCPPNHERETGNSLVKDRGTNHGTASGLFTSEWAR